MRNILLIAKREYQEQIHGRAFIFSTVLVPLLIVALIGYSALTSSKAASGKHFAVAADNASLADAFRRQMLEDKDAKYTVDVTAPASEQDRAALRNNLQRKSIDGLLELNTSSSGAITATYTSLSSGGFDYNLNGLKIALNQAVENQRLITYGVKQTEVDLALKPVTVETLQLSKDGKTGKTKGASTFYKAIMMLLLLSMPIMLYGLDMARSIIEEKTSRIFEVMLAIARPDDLLTGKLVGVGAVGLTQIAIWMIAATLFMGSALAATVLTGSFSIHFSLLEGLLFPVYFVLGYALFSAIFSGLAATCETSQDLQKFMPVAIVPLYMGMGMLPVMLKDPNSVWSIAASLCPLTSPYTMLPLMGLETVPAWQLATSIVLLLLSIWATLWFSSRLYRVGILMYGKRATLPELVRWLRYS
jgi:ABC-2 type transport system permease protein